MRFELLFQFRVGCDVPDEFEEGASVGSSAALRRGERFWLDVSWGEVEDDDSCPDAVSCGDVFAGAQDDASRVERLVETRSVAQSSAAGLVSLSSEDLVGCFLQRSDLPSRPVWNEVVNDESGVRSVVSESF